MKWEADPLEGSEAGFLPGMITDVTLRYPDRTVVIECKYTDCLATGQYLNQTLKSQHLYQLSAYLRNLEYRPGPDAAADGILLYPSTGAIRPRVRPARPPRAGTDAGPDEVAAGDRKPNVPPNAAEPERSGIKRRNRARIRLGPGINRADAA
jgi:hypothetical protein